MIECESLDQEQHTQVKLIKFPLTFHVSLLLSSFLLCAKPASASSDLAMKFSGRNVTVTGVQPGGSVVLFASVVDDRRGLPLLARPSMILEDDDRDGAVSFKYAQNIPAISVWAAVDLATGAVNVASPPGFAPRRLQFDHGSWRAGLARFDIRIDHLDILVVRRTVGAWQLRASEGTPTDADRKPDARLRIDFYDLRPIGKTATGSGPIRGHDVVVAIDPFTLQYFTSEVSE